MGSGVICVFGCGRVYFGNVVDDCYFYFCVWGGEVFEIESYCEVF